MSNLDIPPKSAAPTGASTQLYRISFGLAALSAAVAAAFFVIGLADGSVSAFNMGIWLLLLAGLAVDLWAGHALRSRGRTSAAIAVLAIVALPSLVFCLFMLLIIATQPRWN